jgi:hypothetical protein
MTCRSYRLLLCTLLLFVTALSVSAQGTKAILLNHIDSLPMPLLPGGSSFFFTVNEQPEIIAMTSSEWDDQVFKTNAIVTSNLGKGKLLLLGPSVYLKTAILNNNNVTQLLKNALNWAKPGNSTNIAVAESIDKGFISFLQKQNATVYTTKGLILKKNTDILILDKDVTDTKQLQRIEDFITNGGTLIFASPYSDLYNSKDTIKDLRSLDLGINKLLAKAGVVNVNGIIIQSAKYKKLATGAVPKYLHLTSILTAYQNKEKFSESADFFVGLTIDMAFKYNDSTSVIVKRIRQILNIPAEMPLPSPSKPVLNNTPALRSANRMAYSYYNRQQNFPLHPQAKAIGYDIFPGAVPANAQRVTQKVNIKVYVGSQGLTDNLTAIQSRPHSTGLYVPAGEKVTITLKRSDIHRKLEARIGVHDNDVTGLDQFTRIPLDLTKSFKLEKEEVEVYSPYGGLLLIAIPDTSTLKDLTIQVKGAVKAPYFKLGETSEQDWNTTTRNNPAPWAELATDNIVLTVPAYRIRNLSDPVKLMQFWDEVMNADADLAAMPLKRKHQEHIVIDNDVAYGYMFTTLDKIVAPDDQSCEWMLNESFIRGHGSWGTFHELGHRHQYWPFEDGSTQEVTVNLYTMYVYDKVLHKGMYNHEGMEDKDKVMKVIKNYLDNDPTFNKWRNDPFLALSMYIQIINAFGWDAIKAVNTTYRTMPKDQFPNTPQQKIDVRFITLCKATNSNLTHFFEAWKVPISADAKNKVAGYKEWFPKELDAYK